MRPKKKLFLVFTSFLWEDDGNIRRKRRMADSDESESKPKILVISGSESVNKPKE